MIYQWPRYDINIDRLQYNDGYNGLKWMGSLIWKSVNYNWQYYKNKLIWLENTI